MVRTTANIQHISASEILVENSTGNLANSYRQLRSPQLPLPLTHSYIVALWGHFEVTVSLNMQNA
jgi:hypothetical protein